MFISIQILQGVPRICGRNCIYRTLYLVFTPLTKLVYPLVIRFRFIAQTDTQTDREANRNSYIPESLLSTADSVDVGNNLKIATTLATSISFRSGGCWDH